MFFLNRNSNNTTIDNSAIDEILSRGVVEVIDRERLEKMLRSGRKLRIKYGIDPTSPNIHLGRALSLRKLKILQDLGHTIVLIVGDFTGLIGDTSDKESERPMLSEEKVKENLKTYFVQMGRIIDLSRAESHFNSKWLKKINYLELSNQANQFSLSDFIARDNVKRRLDSGNRVSLREVLYPLMQGYDSVAVKADLEIGGVDQRFNLLSGRTLQEFYKQAPQQLLLLELLPGLDGRKMSSSWGNTINLVDSPSEMYGKIMRLKDELIPIYFKLASRTPLKEVAKISEDLESLVLNPKEAKARLAKDIISFYYSEVKAVEAEANFEKTFKEGGIPDEVAEFGVNEGEPLVEFLMRYNIVPSRSEFGRLISSKAIEIIGEGVILDLKAKVKKGVAYRVGKKRFVKTT